MIRDTKKVRERSIWMNNAQGRSIMINRKRITSPQAKDAMINGEFNKNMISSKKHVVIILTQSWCPWWHRLKHSLQSLDHDRYDIDIYELEYDKEKYFKDFLGFKENSFRNDQIPYVRFYIEGKLVEEANYVTLKEFLSKLNLD